MTQSIEALPPSARPARRAPACALLLLTAGLAAGVLVAGCEKKDPSGKAITTSSRQLGAVAAASSSPGAPASYLEPKLSAVRRDVKDLGSNPSATDTASASLISARSAGGLAAIKAAQAAELETRARRGEQTGANPGERVCGELEISTLLDGYLAQASFAAGMEQFDPAPEAKRLGDDITAKEQEISKAAALKRQLQDEAAKLETDAQAALSAAQAERTTEAQIRQKAQLAASQPKADLITEANKHRRVADGHDKKAADLRAQAAVVAPRIDQADRELNHLTAQRKLLQDAVADIQAMSQSGKQKATEARASVAEIDERIRKGVDDVEKTRAEIDAPTRAALDGYRSAAGDARKAAQGATRDGKTEATLAAAGYYAQAGSVAATRADGFRTHAALLEALSDAKPPLPGADKYASSAAEARKGEDAAKKDASELFKAARDAVTGAGGGDELKAMTERVNKALEAMENDTVEPAKSLVLGGEASKGSAPATSPKGPAPAASGPEGEIKAMLSSLEGILDSGDEAAIEKVVILGDGPFKDLLRESADLDKAFREKFKVSLAEATSQAGLPSTAENLAKMGVPTSLSSIKITTTGPDAGSISFPMMGMPVSVPVKKVTGAWALDLAGSPELSNMLKMAGGMVSPQVAVIKQFAADVRAGKYPDAAAAVKALETAQQGAGGGGG
jgi:hypothetical protein